jgi:hypothetical protein
MHKISNIRQTIEQVVLAVTFLLVVIRDAIRIQSRQKQS